MEENQNDPNSGQAGGGWSKALGIGMVLVTLMGIMAYVSTSKLKNRQKNSTSATAPVIPETRVDLKIPESIFIDHQGVEVQLGQFSDQYWIADIIFTRCPGPCARMTRIMAELQDLVPEAAPVHWISFTADPSHDTPDVLSRYAAKHGADTSRWSFLTGDKRDIYDFAINGLRLAVAETDPAQRASVDDLFIHSTMFVLVDREGVIRGWYNEKDEDVVKKMGKDLLALFKDEEKSATLDKQVK